MVFGNYLGVIVLIGLQMVFQSNSLLLLTLSMLLGGLTGEIFPALLFITLFVYIFLYKQEFLNI